MRPSVPDVHITDARDAEFAAYRALAGQSVVGLIFGLLSPLALLGPSFWVVPCLGAFFSGWALRRIARNDEALTGKGLAWAGLAVSLLLGAAAPTDWAVYRRLIREEARQFTAQWFRYATRGEPEKAHQLTLPPPARQSLGGSLWGYYRTTPKQRQALENYVQMPLVLTLLALGPKADVRFYDTILQSRENNDDLVEQCYAVTYFDEDNEKKSFFVGVQALRTTLSDGRAEWRILRAEGGVRPPGW